MSIGPFDTEDGKAYEQARSRQEAFNHHVRYACQVIEAMATLHGRLGPDDDSVVRAAIVCLNNLWEVEWKVCGEDKNAYTRVFWTTVYAQVNRGIVHDLLVTWKGDAQQVTIDVTPANSVERIRLVTGTSQVTQ